MNIILISLTAIAIASVSSNKQQSSTATSVAEAVAKPYPLETCLVSGEKLGEMGEPFVFTHEGQEIKLCCKSCKKKFDKDPSAYLKKLEEKKWSSEHSWKLYGNWIVSPPTSSTASPPAPSRPSTTKSPA